MTDFEKQSGSAESQPMTPEEFADAPVADAERVLTRQEKQKRDIENSQRAIAELNAQREAIRKANAERGATPKRKEAVEEAEAEKEEAQSTYDRIMNNIVAGYMYFNG